MDATDRPVTPDAAAAAGLRTFDEVLPAGPSDPADTVRFLHEHGSPATVASIGREYHGFVTGGTHPAALGARAHARLIAARVAEGGLEVMNDVVLNQVLLRAKDAAETTALLAAVQDDGRMWCGPTTWRGQPAIRVSVSSWRTTRVDAERAASILVEMARRVGAVD